MKPDGTMEMIDFGSTKKLISGSIEDVNSMTERMALSYFDEDVEKSHGWI